MLTRVSASTPARALLAVTGAQTAYLLVVLVASAAGRRSAPESPGAGPLPDLLVLVPAHDEELLVGDAVDSLLAADYGGGRREVVVIADNCSDRTAAVAAEHGATVWKRDAVDARGKGQALAWAIKQAERERPGVAAIAVIDADCRITANLLRVLGAGVASGADAVQAENRVSNPDDSHTAALRFAGFALFNAVRPRGKEHLGLSCGLLGTGMAFAAATLRAVPWTAFSVGEDREYHARLVASGRRARFAPEAAVFSAAPATPEAAVVQQTRWETGNVELALRWSPRLLLAGIARADVQRIHAAIELLVPPLSLLVTQTLAGGALAAAGGDRRLVRRAAAVGAAQVVYVVGGLAAAGAPPTVYRALAAAPGLIVRKLAQYGRILTGGGATAWERTSRDGAQPGR